MDKTKKQIDEEWKELCLYIKTEVLEYENKSLPKHFIMRLKGMYDGKFYANNKVSSNAKYEYTDILMAFKMNKIKIQNVIKSKEFATEKHMINYIMAIIDSDINNVVDMIRRKEKSQTKAENVSVASIVVDTDKAEYKKKTESRSSRILNDLW